MALVAMGLETATRAKNGSSARTTAQQWVVASMTTWSSGCSRFRPMCSSVAASTLS
jgi:hypothetical protein